MDLLLFFGPWICIFAFAATLVGAAAVAVIVGTLKLMWRAVLR